ncbi:MAG TPA: hypothetical protein VJZ00_20525 [Thermoanaerobaculia bacterium]|nr:hypothetical protein [Thermoanaerobaculia bacterium]
MFARAVLLASALLFLGLAVRERIAIGGPLIARTIASNSSNNKKGAEETLLLYEHASKTIPPQATVAVFKPQNRADDQQVNRVANGQLPLHRIVPADEAADFIITLGAPLDDARYERVYDSPAGSIWRRTHW